MNYTLVPFTSAMLGAAALGSLGFFAATGVDDPLLTPERCAYLTLAAVRPEARGQGVGRALTAHGLAYAAQSGYAFCSTNWRSTNLQAAHFWPQRGFQPVAYRLVRRVDERSAWANGQACDKAQAGS